MVKRFGLLLIFMLLVVIGHKSVAVAQNLNDEMPQIQALVEAGDTDRALRRYESLLQDRLEGWQKAIIQYNVGTVLLSEGQVSEALQQYRTISTNDATPLLQQRLDVNIALAKLMVAEENIKNLESKQEISPSDYSLSVTFLRDALDAIAVAQKSACHLTEVEGGQLCDSLPEIEKMRLEAKRLLSNLLIHYFNYRLEHMSLQGGATGLLIGLDGVLENLNFLKQLSDDLPAKSQYVDLFLMQAQGWDPFWENLKTVIEKASDKGHGELQKGFYKAYEDFSQGVQMLKKNKIEAAYTSFQESRNGVEELVQLVFGHSDLKESLYQLSILYELVLVQEPLQEVGLDVLEKTQKQLEPLVDHESKAIKDLYAEAVQDLQTGRQAAQRLQLSQGRMFVIAASDAVKRMNQEIAGVKNSPILLLEQAIQMEILAIRLNVLKQSSEGKEPFLKESNGLLERIQQRIFPVIEKFYPVAIAQQVQEFRSSAPLKGPDLRCQCSPWDLAIPLVVQGGQEAERAKAALAMDIPELGKAADWQAAALKKWQEALKHLKAPKKPRKREKQEDNKKEKEEKKQQESEATKENEPPTGSSAQEQKPVSGKADIDSVLRLLQEMEKDDRSKPKILPNNTGQGKQGGNGQEQRPW